MKRSHIVYIFSLAKKKESYRSLLDEYKDLPLDATFKDIKKKIVDDPRYNKFSRELSQTPWIVDGGRKTESSVQELICDKLEAFI